MMKFSLVKRRWAIILAIIFLLGFSVRLVYLFQIKQTIFFQPLTLDPEAYEKKASEITASGKFLPEGVFYQSPLYPYFLASFYKIFARNLFLVRLFQILVGALIPVLIYFLSRKFLPISTSLLASFISAFYGPLLYEDALGDKTTLAVFFFVLATLVTIIAYKKQKGWFLAGVFWGLSALLRENSLLVGGVVSLYYGRKKFWQFLLGFLLVILPVTLLNLRTGDFVLITSQAGQNFYIGNNQYSTGSYIAPPFVRPTPEFEQEDFKKEAEKKIGKTLKPSGVSQYWLKQGAIFIVNNAGKAFSLFIRKIVLLLNAYEIPDNYNYYFLKKYIPILRLPFFSLHLIGPLAICGLFYGWKKLKKKQISILYVVIFLYAFTLILFFIVGRYRAPFMPLLFPFSAFAIAYIYERIRKKQWKSFIVIIPLFVIALVLVNHHRADYPISKDYAGEHYLLGNAYRKASMLEHAIKEWKTALAERPSHQLAKNNLLWAKTTLRADSLKKVLNLDSLNANAHLDYGLALFYLHNDSLALKEYEKALEIDPQFSEAWNNLGLFCAIRKSDYKKGKYALEKAVQFNPSNANYWANLGNCHYKFGEKNEAMFCWEKSLSLKPGDKVILENIKKLQEEMKKNEQSK